MTTLQELHIKHCMLCKCDHVATTCEDCIDEKYEAWLDSMNPAEYAETVEDDYAFLAAQDARKISDLTTENYALSTALDWYVCEVQRLKDKYEPLETMGLDTVPTHTSAEDLPDGDVCWCEDCCPF